MININNKVAIIAILILISVKTNAQITVKIDSLSCSNIVLDYHEDYYSPPIHAFFTLENHSGHDILAFTIADSSKGKPIVSLKLQIIFEYDGIKYKSLPMDLFLESRRIIVNEESYNYKGNIGDALVIHNGESIDGWNYVFFPFENSTLSNLPKMTDPEKRLIEYNRLCNLIPKILPTITIEAHSVEEIWNGESFDTYELTEQ